MRIYVASPFGFSEAWRFFYEKSFLPMLRASGHEILDPWSLTDQTEFDRVGQISDPAARRAAFTTVNIAAAAANTAAIEKCDAVLAILDGPDIDSGSAAEIGFAAALGKRIVGYRGDFRLIGDNEATAVNLQVEYFIRSHGQGTIVRTLDAIVPAIDALPK